MNKKNNELHIAFSLGSIIDTKKSEAILATKGVKAFHETLEKHRLNNSIFSPGPSLGFFMALRKLNKIVPDDILKIKFGLISKIDPNPNVSAVILESMKHYLEENKEDITDFGFDVISMNKHKLDDRSIPEEIDIEITNKNSNIVKNILINNNELENIKV